MTEFSFKIFYGWIIKKIDLNLALKMKLKQLLDKANYHQEILILE